MKIIKWNKCSLTYSNNKARSMALQKAIFDQRLKHGVLLHDEDESSVAC